MRPTDPACPRCWAQAYKELGLKRGGLTSTAEVRKAYRARVLQDHPDKNSGRQSAQFMRAQRAYETIMDSKKASDLPPLGSFARGAAAATGMGAAAARSRAGTRRGT